MITKIRYLLADGTIGEIPFDGKKQGREPFVQTVARALDAAKIGDTINTAKLVKAVVLTDEPDDIPPGYLAWGRGYGCKVAYAWMPADLQQADLAFRRAGLSLDDTLPAPAAKGQK